MELHARSFAHVLTHQAGHRVRVAPWNAAPANDVGPTQVGSRAQRVLTGRQRLALSHPTNRASVPVLAGRAPTMVAGRRASTSLTVEVGRGGPCWHASITLRDEEGRLLPPRTLSHDTTKQAIAAGLRLLQGVGQDDIELVAGAASLHLRKPLTDTERRLLG